jgi:hypothetical protein
VAVAEFEPQASSDLYSFEACYNATTSVNLVTVDGGAGTGYGSGEAALDVENIIGMAPQATIDIFQAPDTLAATYDTYAQIFNDDADPIVSTSWGQCELDLDSGDSAFYTEEGALFDQANTQGQTVFAAAGDNGSTDCGPSSPNASQLSVLDPASQPYVVGVGGTTAGSNSEDVWNSSLTADGAGGGGISSNWCMPTYQDRSSIPGVISGYSQSDATDCGATDPYLREVPDVSALADSTTGYTIFYDGSWTFEGGTSGAAPLWAGMAALIDASPFCRFYGSGTPGALPQGLYTIASAPWLYGDSFYDVTNGNNDYTPSGYGGGLYPATTGYDMASGLGTPIMVDQYTSGAVDWFDPGLVAAMCWQYGTTLRTTHILAVVPRVLSASHPTSVHIVGSGFLPISGTDYVNLRGQDYVPSCFSTTSCTVTLPRSSPGTTNLQVLVEDLTATPVTSADRITFVGPPRVNSLTPQSGGPTGRTRVVLRGSNFVGVKSVRFGSRLATSLSIVSPVEIEVTAPPGIGSVYVTVTALGGASARSARDIYRY